MRKYHEAKMSKNEIEAVQNFLEEHCATRAVTIEEVYKYLCNNTGYVTELSLFRKYLNSEFDQGEFENYVRTGAGIVLRERASMYLKDSKDTTKETSMSSTRKQSKLSNFIFNKIVEYVNQHPERHISTTELYNEVVKKNAGFYPFDSFNKSYLQSIEEEDFKDFEISNKGIKYKNVEQKIIKVESKSQFDQLDASDNQDKTKTLLEEYLHLLDQENVQLENIQEKIEGKKFTFTLRGRFK